MVTIGMNYTVLPGKEEVFERAFYDFYLGCLRQIVTGPPEDMAPNGGFWRFLS